MQNGLSINEFSIWKPDDIVDGAAGLAIVIGIFVMLIGILPAVFLRERLPAASLKREPQSLSKNLMDFFRGFSMTIKSKPFLMLCIATFCVFNGFMLVSSLQNYTVIYYIFGGDISLATTFIGIEGTLRIVSSFAVIVFATWLGTRIGKRRAFFITIGVSMLGYAMKWFCYNPQYPWLMMLPAPFLSFGLGGLFTLVPSMVADVVDMDELNSQERREGMYGSIFWWVVKLGQALAFALGGYLLNSTGFDEAFGGNQAAATITQIRLFDALLPIIFSAIAIWAIAKFTITEEKAHEIRTQLEERRGAA
jgi:GPH family glycoside/pentoside/hexuronide:cation symporter